MPHFLGLVLFPSHKHWKLPNVPMGTLETFTTKFSTWGFSWKLKAPLSWESAYLWEVYTLQATLHAVWAQKHWFFQFLTIQHIVIYFYFVCLSLHLPIIFCRWKTIGILQVDKTFPYCSEIYTNSCETRLGTTKTYEKQIQMHMNEFSNCTKNVTFFCNLLKVIATKAIIWWSSQSVHFIETSI